MITNVKIVAVLNHSHPLIYPKLSDSCVGATLAVAQNPEMYTTSGQRQALPLQ